jgi:hypothetical protein
MTRSGYRAALVLALVLVASAAFAPSANAATTRAEYVAKVDPICQAGLAQEGAAAKPLTKKLKRLDRQFKKAHSRKARRRIDRREGRLLTHYFDFVAAVEQGVNSQIATIPPAIEDTSLIQVWLRARSEELVAIQRAMRSLTKGDFFGGLGQLLDVQTKAQEAADLVRDFGFHYCSSEEQEVLF